VISALIDAGLVLELLREHAQTTFERWPFLPEERPAGVADA
jgi:hypothetical protein